MAFNLLLHTNCRLPGLVWFWCTSTSLAPTENFPLFGRHLRTWRFGFWLFFSTTHRWDWHTGVLISLVPFVSNSLTLWSPFSLPLSDSTTNLGLFSVSLLLVISLAISRCLLSFYKARLCHISTVHKCSTLLLLTRNSLPCLSTVHTSNNIHCADPYLVFPFLLSVPSSLLTSPRLDLHRRLRSLPQFPSSPSPCLLAPSNSSLSNCLLSVSLTFMSLTRLCPQAPAAAQSALGARHIFSSNSSRCTVPCLCVHSPFRPESILHFHCHCLHAQCCTHTHVFLPSLGPTTNSCSSVSPLPTACVGRPLSLHWESPITFPRMFSPTSFHNDIIARTS